MRHHLCGAQGRAGRLPPVIVDVRDPRHPLPADQNAGRLRTDDVPGVHALSPQGAHHQRAGFVVPDAPDPRNTVPEPAEPNRDVRLRTGDPGSATPSTLAAAATSSVQTGQSAR